MFILAIMRSSRDSRSQRSGQDHQHLDISIEKDTQLEPFTLSDQQTSNNSRIDQIYFCLPVFAAH